MELKSELNRKGEEKKGRGIVKEKENKKWGADDYANLVEYVISKCKILAVLRSPFSRERESLFLSL